MNETERPTREEALAILHDRSKVQDPAYEQLRRFAAGWLELADVTEYIFPWSILSYVDEEGDIIVEFTDAPPNVHLCAHGGNLSEALFNLHQIYKLYLEEISTAGEG